MVDARESTVVCQSTIDRRHLHCRRRRLDGGGPRPPRVVAVIVVDGARRVDRPTRTIDVDEPACCCPAGLRRGNKGQPGGKFEDDRKEVGNKTAIMSAILQGLQSELFRRKGRKVCASLR